MEPIIVSDNTETALVPLGEDFPKEEPSSEESSSEDEDEGDLPPGPVDPNKCSVGGPGTTGGSAQAPVSFHIHARDSRDKRTTEGGDYVLVKVIPGTTARNSGATDAEAIVKDNGDGSYTATYSVQARGDYELTVEINGSPVGGSPFPVFFSPPEEQSEQYVVRDATGAAVDHATLSATADLPVPTISILGAQAYAAKVEFPEDPAVLERSVLVGNISPQVTLEQLRQLFSYSGRVTDCKFAGNQNQFVLIELTSPKMFKLLLPQTPTKLRGMRMRGRGEIAGEGLRGEGLQETEQALGLDKLTLLGNEMRVEPARVALDSKGQSCGTHMAALQLQQIQQLQKAQLEQHSLAAQVALMRVQAKQNPAAFAPGLPQNSASQKAAALSAIAALSKRLTGASHGSPTEVVPPKDPSSSKRRRSVSPTLRYRSDRRSPRRQKLSPPRRRSSPLRRRSSPVRRRSSPLRRRSRSHERPRSRRQDSRGRGRDRSKERQSHRERESRKARSRSRRRSSPREQSRRDENKKGSRKDQGGDRKHKDEEDREKRREKQGKNEAQQMLSKDQNKTENGGSQKDMVKEEEDLRERALQAVKSLSTQEEPNSAEAKKARKSRHKEKKHKKEKRSKRDAADSEEDLELPDIDP